MAKISLFIDPTGRWHTQLRASIKGDVHMEMTKSFVERTRTSLCLLTNIFRVDAIVILIYQNILVQ